MIMEPSMDLILLPHDETTNATELLTWAKAKILSYLPIVLS